MEKKIRYGFMLSLKEISLRRLAVILYCQPDILKDFNETDFLGGYTLLDLNQIIERKVAENTRKLELPQLLTEQLLHLVEPIREEITYWKFFHSHSLNYSSDYAVVHLQQLCWTIMGTIDYRKSAEKLIRQEMFDAVDLYKLACFYCLDDYIPVLWEKLPDENKIYFYKEEGPLELTEPKLYFCWPYILKGERTKLDYMPGRPLGNPTTFNQYAFEYSANGCNKAATEYFFRKLTNTEKEVALFTTAQDALKRKQENIFTLENLFTKHCDTAIYLLSLLSPGQQIELFKEYPYEVLIFFLDWPWKDVFLDIAELIRPFLTAVDYVRVLRSICSSTRYNLTKLFQKFFLDFPSDFRKLFVDEECQFGFAFYVCFKYQDAETIKVIFRNVDSADRKRLVFSEKIFKRFYKAISRHNWHLVELCLQEATLSKEDKEELKEAYFGFLTDIDIENVNRREKIWEQFLHIIDEGKAKALSKKSLDEEDLIYLSTDSEYDYD